MTSLIGDKSDQRSKTSSCISGRISSGCDLTQSALCQFGADVCLYGFSTFLPIIIEAMGYNAVKAQYLTIPGISV
jgi:hypothetical protein